MPYPDHLCPVCPPNRGCNRVPTTEDIERLKRDTRAIVILFLAIGTAVVVWMLSHIL